MIAFFGGIPCCVFLCYIFSLQDPNYRIPRSSPYYPSQRTSKASLASKLGLVVFSSVFIFVLAFCFSICVGIDVHLRRYYLALRFYPAASGLRVGAIVGGVIGGIIFLILVALLIFLIVR